MQDTPRFRVWPPVALGVPLAAGLLVSTTAGDPYRFPTLARAAGWVLVGLFALWNGSTLFQMWRWRTGLLPGQTTTKLLDRGTFRLSRNPLYVGLIVLDIGIALLWPSSWALLQVPVGVATLWWGAIAPEERYLRAKFGSDYEDYTARVRRWL